MDDKIIAYIKQQHEQGISLLLGQYGGLMKSIMYNTVMEMVQTLNIIKVLLSLIVTYIYRCLLMNSLLAKK
ncbi:hypothetical protein [Metasolibacillus sp.]|nr:hypothetical protein [Metasolibacillus sp.]MCT6924814.1 hypothetical protein [Metasolibacillus sp.]MCT6941082.1 hypothetical protein [Metasolibacillus sp.]